MNKKKIAALSAVVMIAVVGVLLSVTDLGTGLVRTQAMKQLSRSLEADVSMGEVSGNPIKGYSLKDLTLSREGVYSLKIPAVGIKPNIMALLGKGVLVDEVTLSGIDTGLDQVRAFMDSLPESEGSEPATLPVGSVSFRGSTLTLPGGVLDIDEVTAGLKGGKDLSVRLELDVAYGGLPVKGTVSGIFGDSLLKLEGVDLSVGSGRISARGDLLPDLSAKGDISLELSELSSLWPGIADAGLSGKASTAFSAEGTWRSPILAGEVAFDGSASAVPVSGLKGRWSYQDMSMEIPSLEAIVTGVPLRGSLSAAFGREKPKISLKMEASDADLDRLRKDYPQIPDEVSGVVQSLSLALEGPVDGLKGTIKAKADSLKVMGYSLDQSWFSLSLSPDGKAVVSAKTLFQKQPAFLEGSVSFVGGSPKADLTFKVRKFPAELVARLTGQDAPVSGALDLDVKLKGSLTEPSISGILASPALAGFDQEMKDLSVNFALKGKELEIPSARTKWRGSAISVSGKVSMSGQSPSAIFALTSPVIDLPGASLSDVDIEIKGDSGSITISRGSASMGGGHIAASGGVSLGDSPVLDLSLKGEGIPIGKLVPMPIAGALSGVVTVRGPADAPEGDVSVSVPKLSAWGVGLDGVSASMAFRGSAVELKEASASVGGSPLSLRGSFDRASSKGSFEISGKDLDLTKAGAGMADVESYGIGGKVSLSFKGSFDGDSMEGSGELSAPSLTVMNLVLKDLKYPVNLKGSRITVDGAVATLYGGSVKGSGWFDVKTLKFAKKASVSGTDVAPLIRDFAGTEGTVTGLGEAAFEGGGTLSPFSFKGFGTAKLGGGEVVGFPLAKVAASLHGAEGIRYKSADGKFRIEDSVFLLDGSSVVAHEGDPIYKTFGAKGSVGPDRKLALSCAGEVNMKLLNAVVGAGVGGVLGGGAGTLAAVIGGVLGGAQQGIAQDDFRDVTFRLTGTMDSSSVKDLKIGPSKMADREPVRTEAPAAEAMNPPVPETPEVQEVRPENLEDQVKDALLEHIFGGGKNP